MSDKLGPFGWVPPKDRTPKQHEAHERGMAMAEPLVFEGYREVTGRFALWKAIQRVLKPRDPQILPYNWQTSGSCVGAAWGNIAKTTMAVEIVAGELEEWKTIWWPFTYARGRFRGGMTTPGEGSFGTPQAEAAVMDGCLAVDDKPGLPEFAVKEGWIQLNKQTEIAWSDGDAANVLGCTALANLHLFGGYAKINNATEGKAALANGYGITQASMFGTRGPVKKGSRYPVYMAEWDDEWAHQMFYDEAWDHPELGLIFRNGNNWGPRGLATSPEPTQDEPWGGFYIAAQTFDRVCRTGEVFAFRGLNGWRVRELDFFV